MKIFLTTIYFFVAFNCFSQSLVHLDEKNGYGGVLLGDSIAKVKSYGNDVVLGQGIQTFENLGLKTYFIQDREALKANETVKFDNFTISYLNDKIFEIDLYFSSQFSIDMYEILTKSYGIPLKQNDKKIF